MSDGLKADVTFTVKPGRSTRCLCSACFGVGQVLRVALPHTFLQCGKNLYTEYKEYWLCADCRKKLLAALSEEGHDGN